MYGYGGIERYTKKEQIQNLCHSFHMSLEQDNRLVKMAEITHQIALIRNDEKIIKELEFELYTEKFDNPSKELIARRTAKGYLVPPMYTTETEYHELSKEIVEHNTPPNDEIFWTHSLIEVAKNTFAVCDIDGTKYIILKEDLFRYKIKLELMMKRYIASVVIELEKDEGTELSDIDGKDRV